MMASLLDPATVILLVAGFCSFLTIIAFGMPLVARDNFDSRLKAVAARREELQQAADRQKEEAKPG